jgi:hypothetical protein
MNGEVRSKSGNIDVAAYETASLSRCNGKEVGKTLKPSAPSEKKAVYKQTLISSFVLFDPRAKCRVLCILRHR